jgi:hypothetical protein
MKLQKFPMNVYVYNGLLRTYAGAVATPMLKEETKNIYIEDAWNIFRQLQTVDNLQVNVNILNSLLLVHTKAVEADKVEGLVLPLYEKYGIKKDVFTYQHLMGINYIIILKLRDVF